VFQSENIDFDELGLLHLLTTIAKTNEDITDYDSDFRAFLKHDIPDYPIERYFDKFSFVECVSYS
jgi:hypothetical protein